MNQDAGLSIPTLLILLPCVWVGLVLLYRLTILRWLRNGPRGDPYVGFVWHFSRTLSRVVHKLEITGGELVPQEIHPGGMIIVSNHTGAIDPVLIQTPCRFHIRWLMAREMMIPKFDWLWKLQQIIALERDGRDTAPTREAIRHVRAGGVLGIFPEGRIAVPPRQVRPFMAGVGLIIHRTKVPVLLVWVSGTPDTNNIFASLSSPSQSKIHFIEKMDFSGEKHAVDIAQKLRLRIQEVSGWPLNEEVMIPPENNIDPFAP